MKHNLVVQYFNIKIQFVWIIQYNCATNSGGALFLLFSNIYISNSYVLCNSVEIFGGGIFGHQQRTDILDYTLIDDNSAQYANELFCDQCWFG